jgi:tRNA(adenine34) deaminase
MIHKQLLPLLLVLLLGCGGAMQTPSHSGDQTESSRASVATSVTTSTQDTHSETENTTTESTETESATDVDPIQVERDFIYSLLAYAVVLKDWQTESTNPARGHNIGSVLVNPQGEVVYWARNCNKITGNGTQHGEVRLMRKYLTKAKTYSLKNFVVYTTLEPCAMCSGMMVLQQIGRTVYGQTDPDYGKAIERLKLDSSSLPNGYKPYPRTQDLTSEPADNVFRKRIDAKYKEYQDAGGKSLTGWLLTDDAKAIYEEALTTFMNLDVKYFENIEIYQAAKAFYETVPDHYVGE